MKFKKDYECILRDSNTGDDLLIMYAQQVGNQSYGAGFEGGGVASGSQSFTILVYQVFTPTYGAEDLSKLAEILNPLEQNVVIDGRNWLLTSYSPNIMRRMGAGWANKPKTVYLLNLE